MVLGSTQLLTEYQGYLLGDKGGRRLRLTTLPHSCADFLLIMEASTSWNPQGLSRPYRGSFTLSCYFIYTSKLYALSFLMANRPKKEDMFNGDK